MAVTTEQLQGFCDGVNAKRAAYYAKEGFTIHHATCIFECGQKRARLILQLIDHNGRIAERSAYGFVDLETGDLLKAAGWKAPAKGVRGNITQGVTARCGVYGIA